MGIELRNVTKRAGADTHIYSTDLAFEEGGFNVLLGTTLSGKTTLLRLMAGLERPSTGEVWFEGKDVSNVPVQKRSVAMVYQQFINYTNFSVFDNIASPLRVAAMPRREIQARVEDIASLLKLTPLLNRLPAELSGGQQQRTALARALVKNAALVLLDEPLANLDYKLREELRDELPRLFENTGATVVYATTEPLEALMLGGMTVTLHQGAVTQYGPTSTIYRSPNTLLSAQVFSDPPINTATIHKHDRKIHLTRTVNWPVPSKYDELPDGPYLIGIRPHHVTPANGNADSVRVSGTVQIAEISGSQSTIHFNIEDNSWVSESQGVHPYKVGDPVQLYLNVDRCFYFHPGGELIAT
ncbi:ABC transporter ATP-binding protein [Gammaproteobacteria bacterium]|nr:ABC transporter ATP-binding protein [Gammaproteobacteria bacterium]